jgi:4-hydroxyphenylpyruvate dioxygenase-like putative hemolysin
MQLPMPVICKCGFNTMDAWEAINHANKELPQCQEDKPFMQDWEPVEPKEGEGICQ